MTETEVQEYLQRELRVSIALCGFPGGGDGIEVRLLLSGEVIASDVVSLPEEDH